MAVLALVLYAVYLGLAFGLRSWIQRRRTGSIGFRGISGRAGSIEWWGGVLFAAALVFGVVAPVLDLAGALEPIGVLDGPAGHLAGAVLAVAGIGLALGAQMAMGESWRIGVDETEHTELVTTGPFALVRNPIFAAMLPTSLALVLVVPNVVAVVGMVALAVALELQTRVAEEPYLVRTAGPTPRTPPASAASYPGSAASARQRTPPTTLGRSPRLPCRA